MIRLFAILIWLIPSLCFGATTVPIPISEPAGISRSGHPVKVGFPLPASADISDVSKIKVVNSSNVEVDSQRQILSRWSGVGATVWSASHNYAMGDIITPTTANGYYYIVTTDGGSSGGAEPSWGTTDGGTISDGGITWTCHGEAKWVLLDFQATVGANAAETNETASYKVVYGADVTASTPSDAVVVTTETGYYKVDTGNLEFKVSRTDSLKIYDVIIGSQTIVSGASPWVGKIIVGGVEYNTDNADTYTVTLETDGTERVTIKCTGTFEDSSNNEHFQHVTRVEAFAGQDVIKIQHSIIFDQDMMDPSNEPSQMYFSTPLSGIGSTLAAAIGGDATDGIITKSGLSATDNYHLWQKYFAEYSVGADGETADQSGGKSAGWMDVNDGSYGATVVVEDFWERSPSEIEIDSKDLRVFFWPGHDYSDVIATQEAAITGSGNIYVLWPYRNNVFSLRARQHTGSSVFTDNTHNAYGSSLQWNMSYYFHAGTHTSASPTSEQFAKAYMLPLMAWSVDQAVSSEAFGKISEVDATAYPDYENTMSDGADTFINMYVTYGWYGIHWGDAPYAAPVKSAVMGDRVFAHNRMEWPSAYALLYARSGTKKYLDKLRAAVRHCGELDVSHLAGDFTDYVSGHVKKALGSAARQECGQVHWNTEQGYSGGPALLTMQGIPYPYYFYYYITGEKRYEEIAEEIVAAQTRSEAESTFDYSPGSRGLAGALGSGTAKYLHSNDAAYLQKALSRFNAWNSAGFNAAGFHDVSSTDWATMTDGWMIEKLEDLGRWSGSSTVQTVFSRTAKAVFGFGLTNNTAGFYYNKAPFPAIYYGYEITSDPTYLEFARTYDDIYRMSSDRYETISCLHEWSSFTRRALRYMKAADSYDFSSIDYPTFPPMQIPIWVEGTNETSFYVNEPTDESWDITFMVRSGAYMGGVTFPNPGNCYVRIYDPDGVLVGDYSFSLTNLNIYGYQYPDSSTNNNLRTYTVSSDGKTGSYRFAVTVDSRPATLSANGPNITVAACDLEKIKIPFNNMVGGGNLDEIYIGGQKHYFYVPENATSFRVRDAAGTWKSIGIHKPDGSKYAEPTYDKTVTPSAGDKGKFWAVSSIIEAEQPIIAVEITGDVDPYVYYNPYNLFDLEDNYGSTGAPSGASGVKVKSNRWPDFSTLANFGNSAAALMGAVTDTEKALAVYRYVQASTVVVGPLPKSGNFGFTGSNGITYGDLLLNVYGGHDCSGMGETMASVWRGMGYKARTIMPDSGHTQAELAWTDSDLVERYHLFDASGNRLFLWDRDGTRLVSHDDIVLNPSLVMRPENLSKYPNYPKAGPQYVSWWDLAHQRYPAQLSGVDYERLFDLRQNESVQLYFGDDTNRLKYVSSGADQAGGVTDIKHGPYPKVQGTALWTLSPDITTAEWEDGLDSATNLTTDTGPLVHPTAPGTASAIYHFTLPYVVADVEIDADIVRGASDTFKVYVSKDGVTWVEKYAAPSGSTNLTAQSLVVDITGTATGGSAGGGYTCTLEDTSKSWGVNELVQISAAAPNTQTDHTIVRNITTGESAIALSNTEDVISCYAQSQSIYFTAGDSYSITKWPTSSTPVFGRYDYYLKIEMVAASTPTTVGFSALTIRNYTQHNLFSLPQLWPVDNDITVSGSVLGGSKLKVTYQWDDEQGSNRQNVTEIVSTPYNYNIKADSAHWPSVNAGINGTGVKCDYIKIECVPRVAGDTNRITTQEAAPSATTDILPTDAYATSDILLGTINTTGTDGYAPPTIKTASEYRSALATALSTNSFTSTTGVRWSMYGLLNVNTQDAGERASNKTSLEAVMEHLYDYQGTVKSIALAAYCQADNYGSDCVTMCGRVLNRDPDMKWADYAVSGDMSSQVTWQKASQSAALILSRIKTAEAQAYSDEIAAILALNYYTGAYFKIITGANDTATLTCPAGNGTITVTPGTYTGAQLATEVQTQMNVNATLIDGGSVSYTVTYNSTTRKFTIAASAGTIAYDRTTYKSQLMRDLGWTASATSAASITSNDVTFDNATYGYMITALSRALGNLKNGTACSEAERSALSTFVSGPYYDASAAEALGKCGAAGDIPALHNMISVAIANSSVNLKILRPMIAIGSLGDSTHAPDFYDYTTHWDEDFRGYSAEALGKLGNQDAVTYITAARAVEPVGWVQDVQDAALALLGEAPQPGPWKNHGSPKSFFMRPTL